MTARAGHFRVKEGTAVRVDEMPTRVEPIYGSKSEYKKLLKANVKQLVKCQRRLYAANTYSLLIIFQSMDTGGKDGAIRHVMSGVNPQGCQVHSFGHPSQQELDHDFLWRTTKALPERGNIGIFNRSYYEEVLIVRVHPEILEAEQIPDPLVDGEDIWQQRYNSIVDHERYLNNNGTRIIKFFLHISPDEQRRRLIDRIDDPDKNWKLSPSDVEERKYWEDYMTAYSEAISATSTAHAPWYVIPADDKKNARLLVSNVVLSTIEELGVDFPQVNPGRVEELGKLRTRLQRSEV